MELFQMQSQLFRVLTHPTRLAILGILRDGEQCVCHMEAAFGLRQAHISQHLMVLRDAGFVTDRREGWNIFYRVLRPEIYQVLDAASVFTGEPLDYVFAYRKKGHTCPCPKCSSELPSGSLESPALEGTKTEG